MNANPRPPSWKTLQFLVLLAGFSGLPAAATAGTVHFFNAGQTTNLVSSGATFDSIESEGYEFKVSRDKLFTGGVGMTDPIGRPIRIHWPTGLEAQSVTTGPSPGPARIDIRRTDGQPFALPTFTALLLANTAGAGGAIEVMPLLHGVDGAADPFAYDATGFYGSQFTYVTPELTGFDTYQFTLYVDFALTELEAVDANPDPPVLGIQILDANTLELFWPSSAPGFRLEETADPALGPWRLVPEAVNTVGGISSVRRAPNASTGFFRLKN
ncbi:MAG: hypothetical protein U1G08_17080 [Verrucomicrobiota bacterium]